MTDVWARIAASVVAATVFSLATLQSLGALQQGGYKNGAYLRWLRKKENMTFNRLWVWALCLALATAVTSLSFSFLTTTGALAISAVPFAVLCGLFLHAEGKYALKVPIRRTPRLRRLFVCYWLVVASFCYAFIALLCFLAEWNGSALYALIAYVPFCATPVLLPFLLCLTNAIEGAVENARNARFVKRMGQVLDETEIVRVAVVGSYGKTTVKRILTQLLSTKYSVVATPLSYNTPIGVARTVSQPDFAKKQVLIAEMGARKAGDIRELCDMVKPQYAVFTGVCEQHIETFGSLENVWAEKSEILRTNAVVVCGESVRPFVERDSDLARTAKFADKEICKNVRYGATETEFTLCVDGAETPVKVQLLGEAAVEDITLAVALAKEMGLTADEIARGLQGLTPVEHRLQLLENGGVYILDDGYNCNIYGAKKALRALARFSGKKYVVTPGIVECGVLHAQTNGALGALLAEGNFDLIVLVGDTLVTAVKNGYVAAGGDAEKLKTVKTLSAAQEELSQRLHAGDAVLFLNDLPDVY